MPPVVRKDNPTPQQNSKPISNKPLTGILSQAIPVQQLQKPKIKMLIYGQNRVGKTTLACTFPKPLLLVSFEPAEAGGATSVTGVEGVSFLHLTSSQSGLQLCQELSRANVMPFETVVVDSVTSYQDIILRELMNWDKIPEQLNFGAVPGDIYRERAEKTKEGLRPFANLPCHVVFLGKEKDHNPPKEEKVGKSGKVQPDMRPRFLRGMQLESFIAADLGGATVGWLQDVCNQIGRLYFDKEVRTYEKVVAGQRQVYEEETGKHIRCLRTQFHPNFSAGMRSAGRDVPEVIEEPTYEKIQAVIDGTYKG